MTIPTKTIYRILYVIMGLGAILRLNVYLQNRSLFIDEASLSSQLISGSFGEMFGNFVHQYAPPLFNVLVKSSTEIFGATEYALRLVPLIAGWISIWLFYKLCQNFLEPKHIIFPMLLFCFSMYLVRYSTEIKQYSTDIAICMALLLICIKHPPEKLKSKQVIIWGIFGALSVWFSMPVVFVLFAIGIYYGLHFLKERNGKQFLKITLAITTWLISFGIYFFGIIKTDVSHEGLQNFHSPYFFPLIPDSISELKRGAQLILGFYRTAVGSTVVAIGWGILTTIIGFAFLFKKKRLLGWLFLLPFLSCMLASGLKYYSLIPRLTLFLIPILMLVIGIGTQEVFKKAQKYISWVIIGVLFIILANQKSYPFFFKKYQVEEIRHVLNHLRDMVSEEDLVYVHYHAENAFRFYTQDYEYADQFQFKNVKIGYWDDAFPDAVERTESRIIWMVFSHLKDEEMDNILSAFGEDFSIEKSFVIKGARAVPLHYQKVRD